ncbi:MAG TPA: CRTAC1 family protein [Bryobacteraceae bacterium]|nr:CRTAC1 family protein [Bryobacteraceae bacterium]
MLARNIRHFATGTIGAAVFVAIFTRAAAAPATPEVRFPSEDAAALLAARKQRQLKTVDQFKVFYGFQFEDKVGQSGITFVNHIVDDAAGDYKPAHYDHGNGIAVADVDGDGLYDIYFVSQTGGNELWKNLGGGKFENITAEAGVGVPGRISVSAAFADIDNDGDPDLFVTTVRGGNLLFENDGHGHFRDITREAGIEGAAHSSGAVFFDYDHDGLLDLLVCNVGKYTSDRKGAQGQYLAFPDAFNGHMFFDRYEFPVLYRNLGHNRFRDVTAEAGLKPVGWSGDATFTDLNGDGWPQIYFLNMMGANHFFENHGGKFSEQTSRYFPKTPWGAMGIKFFDYDNDGRMDLFVTDMHSDMWSDAGPDDEKKKAPNPPGEEMLLGPRSSFVFGNALYHNLGSGKFEEVSDRMGVENYWPWGPSIGDFNADGWDDIFIASSMNFPFRYGINSLLLNNRGQKFLDAEFLLGVEPRKAGRTHTAWFELDCSKVPADAKKYYQEPCKGQTGKITVMAPLGSRSAAVFDLDNDGDLDIVTNDFNSAPQILVSNLSARRQIHWLKVKLAGTASNRDGLGAFVRVTSGGRTLTKYNDGKSGYLSQSSLPLYFGLGDAKKVDRVEVDWPSGRKQAVTRDLRVNEVLQITETK